MVVHGRVQADFAWSIIGDRSVVHVSASEIVLGKPVLGFGPLVFTWAYNIGHADVWVSNISPRDGGVTFILHVNWGFTPSCGDHDHRRGQASRGGGTNRQAVNVSTNSSVAVPRALGRCGKARLDEPRRQGTRAQRHGPRDRVPFMRR